MSSVKKALLCGFVNIKKWRVEPRLIIILLSVFVFAFFNYTELAKLSAAYNQKLPIWAVTAFFSRSYMKLTFGFLAGLLFCNAPFYEDHSPFLVIRTGRLSWIMGQFVYILIASLVFTLSICVSVFITILPVVTFSSDWGSVIRTLSEAPGTFTDYSVHVSFVTGISRFDPVLTCLLSLLTVWLTTVFVGMFFMFFNSICRRIVSFSVYGALIFLSMSAQLFGLFNYGYTLRYLTPLSFCDLFWYQNFNGDSTFPPIEYGIAFFSLFILIAGIAVAVHFSRKDLFVEEL